MIRVLVAESHPTLRAAMRFLIDTEMDMRVVSEARTGTEALVSAAEYQPDVAVLDMALPLLDASDVTRALRFDAPETAVLCIGDQSDRTNVRRALRSGANGYLSRTGEVRQLVEAVRSVAAGCSYVNLNCDRNSLARILLRPLGHAAAPLSDR